MSSPWDPPGAPGNPWQQPQQQQPQYMTPAPQQQNWPPAPQGQVPPMPSVFAGFTLGNPDQVDQAQHVDAGRSVPKLQDMTGRSLMIIPVEIKSVPDVFNQGQYRDAVIALVTMLDGQPITHTVIDGVAEQLTAPFTAGTPVVYTVYLSRVVKSLSKTLIEHQGSGAPGSPTVVGLLGKEGKAYTLQPASAGALNASRTLLADQTFKVKVGEAIQKWDQYQAQNQQAQQAPPMQSTGTPAPF